MTYHITHRTTFEYSEPVSVSHHAARLEPRRSAGQQCEQFELSITPEPAVRTVRTDFFGNRVCYFSVQQLHTALELVSRSRVHVAPVLPPALAPSPPWEDVAAMFRDPVPLPVLEPCEFVFESPLLRITEELAEFARPSFAPGRPLLSAAQDFSRRIHEEFAFDPKATTVATPLESVLAQRRGVCQDFAQVGIAGLRALGLPARYVSGYLRTRPLPGQPRLRGVDASHAWFAVFCPDYGWLDFDPTNNCIPGFDHVTVAVGRDFSDVSPVSGIITGGGQHDVQVAVDVEPDGEGE